MIGDRFIIGRASLFLIASREAELDPELGKWVFRFSLDDRARNST